jgi:hypothetical protein
MSQPKLCPSSNFGAFYFAAFRFGGAWFFGAFVSFAASLWSTERSEFFLVVEVADGPEPM